MMPMESCLGGRFAEDAGDITKEDIGRIMPVAGHINKHSAAIFSPVIPRRKLDDFSKEPLFLEELEGQSKF